MPTLTEVSYYARKSIKYFGFGLIGFVFLRIFLILAIQVYKDLNPPPPPPPTRGFGLLPPLLFPSNPGYNIQFDLQTPNLSLPNLGEQIEVYYVEGKRANLMAPEEARKTAMAMKFFTEPTKLDEENYEWKRNIPSPLVLKMDIITGAFTLTYQWQTDDRILIDKMLPGKDETITKALGFISSVKSDIDDIDFPNGKIAYLKASGNRLVSTISLSEADFVKADFYRKDINEHKVLTVKPDDGIISIIFSGANGQDRQIVSAKFNYYKLNYLDPETYMLKPVSTAWEQLKKGGGYIAQQDGQSESIPIRRISLAYFDSGVYQEFLQPIYVFYGDNNFVAYVPALDSSEINK